MTATNRPSHAGGSHDSLMITVAAAMATGGALYGAAVASAHLAGHRTPHGPAAAAMTAFAHLADPSAAWRQPVGPAWLYWTVTAATLSLLVFAVWAGWRLFCPRTTSSDPARIEGLAARREIAAHAGPKPLLKQAHTLRPSLRRPSVSDVGWQLGTGRGVPCWMGVRDSMVLLGPPGAGKGYHLVIPAILDAPGAVITTSTRTDNLTATITARAKAGPVGVFDPEGLAAGAPSALRWSPARGCQRATTAIVRAAALCSGGDDSTVTNSSYWKQQTLQGVRCLLHAAAVGRRGAASLYEWSLSAPHAKEALAILRNTPGAIPSWATALDSIVSADPKRRDDIWSMVGNVFSPLADPTVLQAVSPSDDEQFDPASFLRQQGTLYLLGTAGSKEARGTAGLVAALVEDVVDVAKRLAAASPGSRLDPPLTLVLDEAANYPLPSLGALMSEGGGTGIATIAVLQSPSQARDRWGRETAGTIWDASTVKVILGGSSNADDLGDLSRMIGDRQVVEKSETWQTGGGRSYSTHLRQEPIMAPAALRMLPFGQAVLLLRSARPILLELSPWTSRADAGQVQAGRGDVEAQIRTAAGADA